MIIQGKFLWLKTLKNVEKLDIRKMFGDFFGFYLAPKFARRRIPIVEVVLDFFDKI